MSIKIRKAQHQDFLDIHRLIMEFATFIRTPEKVSITPQQMIKDQNMFKCMLAEVDGEIVGFATFFFAYYSWTGKAIYLDDLYVTDNYRGQGVGKLLFEEVLLIGKKEGCYKMKWQVSNWNDKAQEFYKSKGAVIDDTEINCDLIIK